MATRDGNIDWPVLMRAGMRGLGLKPWEFWDLTPAELQILLGHSGGLSSAIKRDHVQNGTRLIEIWEPIRAQVQPGDTVRLLAGCDKRFETCRLKFLNGANFQGFPDLPDEDWVSVAPGLSSNYLGREPQMTPIVTSARGWIGTPYLHQCSRKGAGCDCLGLLRGVWREVIGPEPEVVPAYSRDWSETGPDELLWARVSDYLIPKPIDDTETGDVVLFRMRSGAVAKHIGIQTQVGSEPAFVHAYFRHGVCETSFNRAWARRTVARFAFPQEIF
jgi:NlpC/P60 family putative phage cell wall peptidase/uncharacterized phage protein (TIGR02216 family)